MDWRSIPSLSSLRAFEAVARAGSFSAAARDLNVTHAAIAQHVRALEADLKTNLLARQGRGMVLTDPGTQLATALTDGFTQIIAGIQQITQDAEARPIALSVTPSFAENWLMPRFSDFWAKHPDIPLSILPSCDVFDLRRDGIDLAVRYGLGEWSGLTATPLLKADFTVVAAPELVAGRKVTSFADLNGLPWLFETVHQEARRWVMESGLDLDQSPINEVATFGMVMSAVRSGKCLSVVSSALVADEIKSGKLVTLMQLQPEGLGYFVVHPKGVLSPRAKILKAWLRAAV
ncbi:LysR family transcriptional regulator [Yoonia sp.]|nr:LysR family transcriptional regulator [Yoonia sp.]